jgi:hypothetical protein
MPETLLVPRADFSIEEPWAIPGACTPVPLRLSTTGAAAHLPTSVAAYCDREQLTLVFSGADDHVVATHTVHDAPLYEEDVVEAFLAPLRIEEYFELEASPRGVGFDARIESPDGVRATMRADRGWTCADLFIAVKMDGGALDVVMRIPFASLGVDAPADGETWRANFFRIDRHPERGDEYLAWSPTLKTPADFHVTDAFGTLRFGAAESS